MTPFLLNYLREPGTKALLTLVDQVLDEGDNIISGSLVSPSGRRYPIIDGVPRFVESAALRETVQSFGDEWNHFNFTDQKVQWLEHIVRNTFGSTDIFKDKVIVDCGGGSGAQSKWFAEYGAKHVIMLELSHTVDGVARKNLAGLSNVDIVQCSIDAPPLESRAIDGIVYCCNVIQHTPSVEKTAVALFDLVAPGGEFVFNCYPLNDRTPLRWLRYHVVQKGMRAILSRLSFNAILSYAKLMASLRTVPGLGNFLEKAGFCVTGDVPAIAGESRAEHQNRVRRATALNTFDGFGSHAFQHHKSDGEIQDLVRKLDPARVLNEANYFSKPPPIGCSLRLFA
jgi:2-polyprenyl-3-methyl-5-hydroxy-6-metoxy-1,4-benzoquinol methylase